MCGDAATIRNDDSAINYTELLFRFTTPVTQSALAPLSDDDEAPLRADARRNLRRILAAAEELFAEEGPGVSIDAIARRAGVGVGTVYRRFPTKAALGEAIVLDHLSGVAEGVAEIVTQEPDDLAVFAAIRHIVISACARRDLKETLSNVGIDLRAISAPVFDEIGALVGGALARAQAAGAARPDVGIEEILGLVGACCHASDGGIDPARLVTIVEDGLRTAPAGR